MINFGIIILITVTIFTIILSPIRTIKEKCESDCTSFFSNAPDWTCVKSCLEVK